MKNMWIRNKKNKVSLKSKILLGALVLVVTVGLGGAAYAASANSTDNLLSIQTGIIDPFTLQSTRLSATSASGNESDMDMSLVMLFGEIKTLPEIRIPYRPAIRTPFRPPLTLR